MPRTKVVTEAPDVPDVPEITETAEQVVPEDKNEIAEAMTEQVVPEDQNEAGGNGDDADSQPIHSEAAESKAPEEPKSKKPRATRRKTIPAQPENAAQPASPRQDRRAQASILTIEADGEIETQENREDTVWHYIQNAFRTKRILTGVLGGIESSENGNLLAVVYYKEFRVAIPLSEMMIRLAEDDDHRYGDMAERQSKVLGNMLGAEIDFIVKGLDARTRSIVASRKDAMLKKRQTFYMGSEGSNKIREGRIVQARVIAVAQKVIRVEAFGVESSILARDLSWDWIGDAHERFSVGDQVLIRVHSVKIESLEKITITADAKSAIPNTIQENLKKCRVQGKYAGKVTDVYKGVVYVRLSIGVNGVAHSCFDNRTPGKKDDVSFAVTNIDEEKCIAIGIITRIIKQNI